MENKIRLLFGTGNPAKLGAMRRTLAELPIEILGLADMDREAPQVPEDGGTPLENARQKAWAYYKAFGISVFSCDSGLYFEDLPEQLQPGVHVRTVGGRYLTDGEMLEYYGGLAARYGNLKARYRNAVCLITGEGQAYERMDESTASPLFLLTSVPHSQILHKGFPLDSLSVDMATGKYFYDLEEARMDQWFVEEGMRRFFRECLGMDGCLL